MFICVFKAPDLVKILLILTMPLADVSPSRTLFRIRPLHLEFLLDFVCRRSIGPQSHSSILKFHSFSHIHSK